MRMALQNRENGVVLSFTTVEKEDEDNIQGFENPDIITMSGY